MTDVTLARSASSAVALVSRSLRRPRSGRIFRRKISEENMNLRQVRQAGKFLGRLVSSGVLYDPPLVILRQEAALPSWGDGFVIATATHSF